MGWVWLFWCAFCAALAEIILGNYGTPVPVWGGAAVYFTVVMGWRRAFVPLAFAGTIMDMTLSRSFPVSAIALPAVMVLALFWRRHGDCRAAGLQWIPGALLGLIVGAGTAVWEILPDGIRHGSWPWHSLWFTVHTMAAGALLLPLLCWLLDLGASRLALPLYRDIQHHEETHRA